MREELRHPQGAVLHGTADGGGQRGRREGPQGREVSVRARVGRGHRGRRGQRAVAEDSAVHQRERQDGKEPVQGVDRGPDEGVPVADQQEEPGDAQGGPVHRGPRVDGQGPGAEGGQRHDGQGRQDVGRAR